MAGPGGREVGRVSVRVVPNTEGFRDKVKSFLTGLEKSLKLEVELDIDKRSLGKLAGKLPTLTAPVRANTSPAARDVATLRAEVASRQAELRVTANTAEGRARAIALVQEINRLRAEIEVKIKADKRGIDGGAGSTISALGESFRTLLSAGSKLPFLLGSVFGGLGNLAEGGTKAFGVTSKLVGSFTEAGGAASKLAGGLASAVVLLVQGYTTMIQAGAQLSVFALIAGVVTFALGALGAALSGLPALLFGVGAAAGVAYLGMDGIKRAAETAKPAFEQLKSTISAVFEKELTPAFQSLAKMLPQITNELKYAAGGVANLIKQLLGVVTSVEGVRALQKVFQNTRTLIENMTPGLVTFVSTLLQVASQAEPVFREIGLLVSGLSLEFAELFGRFAEGGPASLMARSFKVLREVVLAVADVFTELILGATEFFTAAGPGVVEVFNAIRDALKNIDFKALGESFGEFASGVATFIRNIPPETWDNLVNAIQNLSREFFNLAQNKDVQDFFNGLILIIPALIRMFAGFVSTVSDVISFVMDVSRKVRDFFSGGADAAEAGNGRMGASTSTTWGSISRTIGEKAAGALSAVKNWITRQGQMVLNAGLTVAAAVRDGWNRAVAATRQKITEAVNAVRQLPGKAKSALGNLGSMLLASGKALIDGFIAGIKGAIGRVRDAAASVVRAARDYFPFSPAKKGPFSGSGWVDRSGESVATAFSQGMLRKRLQVANAAATLMGAAQLFDSARAAAAGRAHADAYRAAFESSAATASRAIAAATSRIDPLTGSVAIEGPDVGASTLADVVSAVDGLVEALTERGLPLDTRRGELVARLAQRGAQKLGQL